MLLTRIRELSQARVDFGFETTLAGKSYVRFFDDLRAKGYRVLLHFLWLPSADAAVLRVANRVRQGGHNIPEATIRRRYAAGLRNFFELYPSHVDEWSLYNGLNSPPECIADRYRGEPWAYQFQLYEYIKEMFRIS